MSTNTDIEKENLIEISTQSSDLDLLKWKNEETQTKLTSDEEEINDENCSKYDSIEISKNNALAYDSLHNNIDTIKSSSDKCENIILDIEKLFHEFGLENDDLNKYNCIKQKIMKII